jgi:thioredoxin 1
MEVTGRRAFVALALAAIMPGSGQALAAPGRESYSDDAFRDAQERNQTILVEIWASWCPVCRAQVAAAETIMRLPPFDATRVFRVDFDRQKQAVGAFDAKTQSTLIVFKGWEERGRAVGITNPSAIRMLLMKAT